MTAQHLRCVTQEGDTTQIQDYVDMVDRWSNHNDMRLNSVKCKEIVIEHAEMLGTVTISLCKHIDNIVS